MMRQNNISFDTYYGRILDPTTTTMIIESLNNFLINRNDPKIKMMYSKFLEFSVKYIESSKINVQNMGDAIQQYYIVMAYLFNKILSSTAKNIKDIFQQDDFYHYILLKRYMITFLNLINEVHPNNEDVEFNKFCYDYLLNGEIQHKTIHVIENINTPDIKITQVLSETLEDYLKKNQLILTLSGCLFYKHEKKTSMFFEWIGKMTKLRKQYVAERKKHEEGTDGFDFYDSRQLAVKIASNTLYGLMGQTTYRYSNNWLAKSITGQGRLTLKISQQIAEDYLKNYKG